MEITYLGHASFKLKAKSITVVTDPYGPLTLKSKFPEVVADVVTISHEHKDHSFATGVGGTPLIISGPGEYEIKGVRILGLKTYHDEKMGKERGKNTVYQIKIGGLSVVHCGDLGHKFSDSQIELLDEVDILIIPVGGKFTLAAKEAVEVIARLEPSIVIPMHYKTPSHSQEIFGELMDLATFLKEMGKEDIKPQAKLVISKDKLPVETTVVVLESKADR